MRLFRRSEVDDLPVAMSGVKLADRVLVIGCSDPLLIAKLALKVGLTGRACAVDESPDRVAGAQRVAEREGTLIETAAAPGLKIPYESEGFDLVVVREVASPPPERLARALVEALRVLRRGGRCLLIEGAAASRVAGLFRRAGGATVHDLEGTSRAVINAGFAAVRTLAERDGVLFVEGVKRNA
jgi:SAM-dependent methyltransferase